MVIFGKCNYLVIENDCSANLPLDMRARALIVLFLLVCSLTVPASVSAAVKQGDACKKVGATSISKGMKFTCVKSGKKLVWGKGIKVVTPASNPTSKGEVQATTPSPVPTATPIQPAIVPAPNSPEIAKLDLIVDAALKSSKPVNVVVDFQVGPGKEVAVLGQIAKESLDSALRIASILEIEFSKPVKAYVGTREWLLPKMPAGTWCVDPIIGVPGSGSGGFCGIDNGIIFISIDGYLSEPGSGNRDFSKNPDKILVSFGFVHEMVHWMQAEATVKYAKSKGFYNSYWLNEGGANFGAMMAQAYLHKVPFSKIRTYIATYGNCISQSEKIKVKDYITNKGQSNNCGPYYSGYLWTEYLVSSTGDIGALINLAKQITKVESEVKWDPNKPEEYDQARLAVSLKYQYGIDFEEFVKSAEKYGNEASISLGDWFKANPKYWPEY